MEAPVTLADLASLVCSKVGKTDAESLSVCKSFLRQRHEMIYHAGLWKDTVGVFEQTVVAQSVTAVLPYDVARPLVVWDKVAGLSIPVTSLIGVAIVNPSSLTEIGGTTRFVEAESVGWPYAINTPNAGYPSKFQFYPQEVETFSVNISGEASKQVLAAATRYSASETVDSGNLSANAYYSLRRMAKPQTLGPVLVTEEVEGPIVVSPSPSWLWPAESEEASFATIRLINPPQDQMTLGVLAKRKLVQMRLDTDTPMIRGIENALLAFAQADMLERSRQYAKATAKVSEGSALLQSAKDVEVRQAAHEATIVPEVSPEEGLEDW